MLNKAPVQSPTATLVLLALANHADPEGRNCFPAIGRIARYTRLSTRSVINHLQTLEEQGIIYRSDQRVVASYIPRPDRRPIGYNINLHLTAENYPLDESGVQEVHAVAPNGVHLMQERGAGDAHKPSIKPSLKDISPLQFETFWKVYPRKVGKRAALKAFQRAVSDGVTVERLVEAAAQFAQDPNRVELYTPHPATWLNQGRWDDDPLPQRQDKNSLRLTKLEEMTKNLESDWGGMRELSGS